jgi:hypothetical protein
MLSLRDQNGAAAHAVRQKDRERFSIFLINRAIDDWSEDDPLVEKGKRGRPTNAPPLAEALSVRAHQAVERYLEFYEAGPPSIDNPREFNDWHLKREPGEFVILIGTLAEVWCGWWQGTLSPRTRKTGAEEGRYPFAEWVRELFISLDEDPPPKDRIRRSLSRGKRQLISHTLSP